MTSVFAKPKYIAAAYPNRFEGSLLVHTIAGGTPTDPKVAEGWLRRIIKDSDDVIRQEVAEVMVERGVTADEAVSAVIADKHLNGFKRDKAKSDELYIDGRQLKACIKEAACIRWPDARWGPTKKGTKGFFAEHVFVVEDRLAFGVNEPSGVMQRFVRSRFGSAISYEEYIEDAKVDFTVITDYAFKAEEWAMLWLTAEQNGLGASRSQGFGRFQVTRWDKA